ncbi:MAG: hypothetical protein KDB68_00655 [Planctomycetes bacterium]|nr:hypothetical protein [Planctomycetota bacterium]
MAVSQKLNTTLLALLVGTVLVVTACQSSGVDTVDISPPHEYQFERRQGRRTPVILIPGTLGSRLYNTENGEIAWGNFSATISELQDELDLPIDRPRLTQNRDNLAAYRVLDRAEILLKEGSGEVSFYAELIDHLSQTLGYRPAYGKRFHRGHDLFVFFYDWRRSNVEAATQLREFIESIRRDLRQPKQKFTFLAVSNGGMIARYYLRYGGRDVVTGHELDEPLNPNWNGLQDCERLICMGTPHVGTIDALHLIHDGYAPNVLARRYPPATIFSFPAAFELMPEPGEPVFVGEGGESLDIDIWDSDTWEQYGLSVFAESQQDRLKGEIAETVRPGEDRDVLFNQRMNDQRAYLELVLKHAHRFRDAIAGEPGVPTEVILGVNTPTLARVGLVRDGEDWQLFFRPRFPGGRYDPMAEAIYASGDGVVTRRSGLGLPLPQSSAELLDRGDNFRRALSSWTFTPFSHREMFDDQMLRLTLAETLSEP